MENRINYAPCGYITLSPQGVIKDINQTFLKFTGYEAADLIDMYFETFLSAASKIMFHSLFFPQLQLKGHIEELYLTFKDKNNAGVPVLLMGNKIKCGDSEVIDCVIVKMNKRDDYEKELESVKVKLEDAYKSENKLRKLFETTLYSINEGIIVTDNSGNITIMNTLAEDFTGWQAEEAKGKKFGEVFSGINSKTQEREPDIVMDILKNFGRKVSIDDIILISRSGAERFISGTSSAVLTKEGMVSGVVTSFRDITKEYLQEKEIDSFLNVNMEMLCVIDENTKFHKINKKFESTLGYQIQDLQGKDFLSFVHEEDVLETMEVIQSSVENNTLSGFTNRYQCKDGSYKYIEWYQQPGAGRFIYSSARDVTEKKMKEEQLLKIAVRDQLTGLYNRHYLDTCLEYEMKKAELEYKPLTLAILDLDHFKRVNDTWGHPIGDELLKLTAETVEKSIRKTDLLVRFGGEEFVIVMPQTDVNAAMVVLEKVRAAIEKTEHSVTGRQTVSIGTAERLNSEIFGEWYKRADSALYSAKEEGRNRVVAF